MGVEAFQQVEYGRNERHDDFDVAREFARDPPKVVGLEGGGELVDGVQVDVERAGLGRGSLEQKRNTSTECLRKSVTP